MPVQAAFAAVFFAMLFVAFVVLPTFLRKRRDAAIRQDNPR